MLGVDVCGAASGLAREVLPAVEVDVGLEVCVPRVFDRGLERHDEDARGLQPLRELVGRERLAEAHLGVPEEFGHSVGVFAPDRLEVVEGLLDCGLLFGAHREGRVVGAGEALARAQLADRGQHIVDGAAHPLELRVGVTLLLKSFAHVEVAEDAPVVAIGRLVEHDLVVLDRRGLQLLRDPHLDVLRRLPDLEQPLVRVVLDRVRVDAQAGVGLERQELVEGLRHRGARPVTR
ncbi:hypothetical protein GCM10025738_11230 [Microbacterium fluvii]